MNDVARQKLRSEDERWTKISAINVTSWNSESRAIIRGHHLSPDCILKATYSELQT